MDDGKSSRGIGPVMTIGGPTVLQARPIVQGRGAARAGQISAMAMPGTQLSDSATKETLGMHDLQLWAGCRELKILPIETHYLETLAARYRRRARICPSPSDTYREQCALMMRLILQVIGSKSSWMTATSRSRRRRQPLRPSSPLLGRPTSMATLTGWL